MTKFRLLQVLLDSFKQYLQSSNCSKKVQDGDTTIFMENKRKAFENSSTERNAVFYQLQGYMLTSGNVQGNVQDMYGLVGIGKLGSEPLHVVRDSGAIDGTLQYLVGATH
ncbi:hypothetical protein VTN00DRAFT_4281 [Thermoascus crustaceus]|uniref:uncharacterized protein n=1 Tax=Thermoascus crustaceus TaxID=5088 RepID=UPI0037447B13